jgi:methionyl-tRNA synthetase
LTFVNNFVDGVVPNAEYIDIDNKVFDKLSKKITAITKSFANYKVREATKLMMDIARIGNKYFDETKPWELKNTDPIRLGTALNVCMNILRVLSVAMYPIIPFSAEKLWKMLGEDGDITAERWEGLIERKLNIGQKIGTIEILFIKYEDKLIQAQIDKLLAKSKKKTIGENKVEEKELVTIDDFKKFDIRVAEIIEAEVLPKSKKLIKLQVKVGDVQKQILAGIKEFYDVEDLVGRKIVIVNNLQPAKLMGEVSEGMLLAASDSDKSRFSLLEVSEKMQVGDKIS